MKKYIEELKRRNVIKAAIGYVIASWVLIQVLSIVLPTVNAPEWVLKTIMLLLVICFPVWIVFAWIYEVTPNGIKKTVDVSKEESISSKTNKRFNVLIVIGLVILIAILLLKPNTNSIYSSDKKEFAIAVLPFDDMSAKKDSEWFCDGMTEDILTHLSKIKGLKVVSRTSTERYKNTDKTVPQIANELGVSYVVEGSVRKHNDDVLITAQLINAKDEHVWADNFNEKLKDVFKVQGTVSRKIVQQLKISISPKEEKELDEVPTTNIKAYEAYLKGRSLLENINPKSARNSIIFFKKAIELDPNYADAYAELAFATMASGSNSRESFLEIEKTLDKALDLNPNSSRANSYKGVFLYFGNVDKKGAIKYLEKALKLNPNDAKAHDMLAAYYSNVQTGNQEENYKKALYHAEQSVTLNPFSSQSHFIKNMALIGIRKLEDAEKFYHLKKHMFTDYTKIEIISELAKEKVAVSKSGPQIDEITIFKEYLDKYPIASAKINRYLAGAYDGILNDQETYLKYAKLAFEQDTTYTNAISEYHTALVESNEFEKAKQLRNSVAYANRKNSRSKLLDRQYAEYHQGNFKTALSILLDSIEDPSITRLALVYAQLNDKEKVKSMLPKIQSNANKALIYAILKNKDSLFYYLNETKMTANEAALPNSRKEMDPYRKDPRYIQFLNKYRFPIELQKN